MGKYIFILIGVILVTGIFFDVAKMGASPDTEPSKLAGAGVWVVIVLLVFIIGAAFLGGGRGARG